MCSGCRGRSDGGGEARMVHEADPLVILEVLPGGAVARLTLNRPHVLNALNMAMAQRLIDVLEEVSERREVRAVILTGAGERAFSAGGDLKRGRGMTEAR